MKIKKYCRRNLKKNAGYTLIEAIFTVGIFTFVIGSLFTMLIHQNSFFNRTMSKFDVSRMTRKVMNIMVKEIRFSNLLTVSIYDRPMDRFGVTSEYRDGKSIEFQVPVDYEPKDGDFTDEFGRLEWGADGQLDWSIEYCWDSETEQVFRRVWDENSVLVSEIEIGSEITSFSIKGYSFKAGPDRYKLDSAYKIIEIELSSVKTTMAGRTLDNPISCTLSQRIMCRNS
ncbi:MAG: hypothetical protein KKB82_07885 [Candidatus Omnitrophica bacterium]|nr:hypothetical protein [Candidatus Omnitrophota bacterium]MBU1925823.1 hypothetical protein [Candidatus Omnitrophota bacterium]